MTGAPGQARAFVDAQVTRAGQKFGQGAVDRAAPQIRAEVDKAAGGVGALVLVAGGVVLLALALK